MQRTLQRACSIGNGYEGAAFSGNVTAFQAARRCAEGRRSGEWADGRDEIDEGGGRETCEGDDASDANEREAFGDYQAQSGPEEETRGNIYTDARSATASTVPTVVSNLGDSELCLECHILLLGD